MKNSKNSKSASQGAAYDEKWLIHRRSTLKRRIPTKTLKFTKTQKEIANPRPNSIFILDL